MTPMFGLGILEIFFIMVVLLVFAVVKRRSGVALAIVGALALFLLVPVTLIMIYTLVRFGSQVVNDFGGPPALVSLHPPNTGGWTHSPMSGGGESYAATWKVSFVGILAVLGGLVAFVVAILRRRWACSTGSGVARWWPLTLIALLPVFFLFGSLRVSRHSHVSTTPPPVVVSGMAPMAQVHEQLAQQIQHGDIHQLMDQADAPRIVIGDEVTIEPAKVKVVKIADAKEVLGAEEGLSEITNKSEGESEPAEKQEMNEDVKETTEVASDKADEASEEAKDSPIVKPESAEETVVKVEQESASENHGEKKAVQMAAESHSDDADSHSHDAEDAKAANSIAEDSKSKIVDSKPEWVKNPPKNVGPVQKQVIATEEYSSIEECRRAMDVLLLFATNNHLMNMNGHHFADQSLPSLSFHHGNVMADGQIIMWNGGMNDYRLSRLRDAGIGIDFIRREIAKDEYVETVERSVGPMTKIYTLVEFSPAAERELQSRYDTYRRLERFAVVGMGAASVLGLLGMVWGLFKVDTATKGYYTKRLFLGLPLGILGLIGFYVLLVAMGADLPH